MIAESIISAASQRGPLRCPIVVRLQGTNSEEGQSMVRTNQSC
jgi:succinyl-CoA synthetase beta subunit